MQTAIAEQLALFRVAYAHPRSASITIHPGNKEKREENSNSPNSKRECEIARGEANIVILERNQEENGVHEHAPDGNVCEDAGDNIVVCVHDDGAVPVEHEEGKCEGHGGGCNVDEAWCGRVAQVEREEVEEVEDEDYKSDNVDLPAPEKNEEGLEKVVAVRGLGCTLASPSSLRHDSTPPPPRESERTYRIKWLPTDAAGFTK